MGDSANKPTLFDWIRVNLEIGALSFGGTVRVFLYKEIVVDRYKWMEPEEFQSIFTLIQVMPGPNLVNLGAYLGHRFLGFFGSLLGMLALGLPGALMAVSVVSVINLEKPVWTYIFRGFAIGSVALFASFVVTLSKGLGQFHGPSKGGLKLYLRWFLAGVIAVAALSQRVNYLAIIGFGIVAGVFLEFAL